jgi:hypothetical protein
VPDLNVDLVALANGFILFVAVIGGFAALWRTLIHPGLKRTIHNELEPIHQQFAIDGGLSLRDAIDRVEKLLKENDANLRRRIETLERALLDQED